MIDDTAYRNHVGQAFGKSDKFKPVDVGHVSEIARASVVEELVVQFEALYNNSFLRDAKEMLQREEYFESLLGALSPFKQRLVFAVFSPYTGERFTYGKAAGILGVPLHRVGKNFRDAMREMMRQAHGLAVTAERRRVREVDSHR